MKQRTVLLISLLILLLSALLAWQIDRASPGPASQDVLGVTLGTFDSEAGLTFLSGRRLDCASTTNAPYTSTCTIEIAGQPLIIQAYRNGDDHHNELGGGCAATYNGQSWPCEISSRHVHVHWFAHISDPLGLDDSQLAILQRRYFFENLPEEPIMAGIFLAPLLVTAAALLAFFSSGRPVRRRGWAAAVFVALITYSSAFVFAFQLTVNFWD